MSVVIALVKFLAKALGVGAGLAHSGAVTVKNDLLPEVIKGARSGYKVGAKFDMKKLAAMLPDINVDDDEA